MRVIASVMGLVAAVAAKGALVIIDVQNCFIVDGTLAVAGGETLVPLINNLRDMYDGVLWDEVVLSQDYHPKPHASFASANDVDTFTVKNLTYNMNKDLCADGVIENNINSSHIVNCTSCNSTTDARCTKLITLEQTMWPDHCLQNNTPGADDDFAVGLTVKDTDFIQQKGKDPWIDSYSAFFSNGGLFPTGLETHLKDKDVDTVFVVGIASDFCVKYSSIDAQSVGFKAYMVKDLSKGIAEDLEPAYTEMTAAGVTVIEMADLAAMVNATTEPPSAGSSLKPLLLLAALLPMFA